MPSRDGDWKEIRTGVSAAAGSAITEAGRNQVVVSLVRRAGNGGNAPEAVCNNSQPRNEGERALGDANKANPVAWLGPLDNVCA